MMAILDGDRGTNSLCDPIPVIFSIVGSFSKEQLFRF